MVNKIDVTDLNEADFNLLNGYQKTALFLYLIGHQKANEILKNFDLKDQKEIRKVLAGLAPVRSELGSKVLSSFLLESAQVVVSESPQEFGKLLSEAKSMVNSLLDEGFVADNVKGLEELKTQSADTIFNMIDGAHPQLISTILAYLDDFKAAAVLEHFEESKRSEYVKNISRMESIKPTALKDLALILDRQNQSEDGGSGTMPIGGTKTAASILNFMTPGRDEKVLSAIAETDQSLAEEIRDKMFVFQDLMSMEPISMQKIVAALDMDTLSVALKGQPQELVTKFSSAMSQRQSARFLEDMADRPAVKMSDVNDAQKRILAQVRTMHDNGEIVIPGKGDDYV